MGKEILDTAPATYKARIGKERHRGKNGNGCRNGIIREETLLRGITAQLGWVTFDEKLFEETADSIVIAASTVTLRLKEE